MEKLDLPQIEENANLDELTEKIEKVTREAITKTAPKINNTKKRKPFWTQNLENLKRKLKASRKSYRAAGDHELRTTRLNKYRQIKQFEKEIFENKKKTWCKFVDENLSKDIWGMPYKIVMQKIRTKGVMNTLKKDDGTCTINWLETVELLFSKLFPDDIEEEDNEENKRIRHETEHPPADDANQEPPTVTNDEVAVAIKHLNPIRHRVQTGFKMRYIIPC